jgi:hypothetical protein
LSRDPRDDRAPLPLVRRSPGAITIDSFGQPRPEPDPPIPDPCPRCAPAEGLAGPYGSRGVTCPNCGRWLDFPAGLPGGTILSLLLYLRLLGEPLQQAWETARDILDDEGLRANLLAPLPDDTPDALISLNHAEVPDPISPAVIEVMEKEQAHNKAGIHRLVFGLQKRAVMLRVILKETYGAGFQRDEARVAARLGFHLNVVRLALKDKKLTRV